MITTKTRNNIRNEYESEICARGEVNDVSVTLCRSSPFYSTRHRTWPWRKNCQLNFTVLEKSSPQFVREMLYCVLDRTEQAILRRPWEYADWFLEIRVVPLRLQRLQSVNSVEIWLSCWSSGQTSTQALRIDDWFGSLLVGEQFRTTSADETFVTTPVSSHRWLFPCDYCVIRVHDGVLSWLKS